MKILTANEEHVPWIVEIWKEFIDFHRDIDPFFTRSRKGHIRFEQFLREMMESQDGLVLIATFQDEPVAYSISKINRYPPVFLLSDYGYICDMAVKSTHRRKGIGERMLLEILKWFDARGMKRIELRVIAKNKMGVSFWKKMGFETYAHAMFLERDIKPIASKKPLPDKEYSFQSHCPFCQRLKKGIVLLQNEWAFAILDKYPVTEGHTLIMPKQHKTDYFNLTGLERSAIDDLILFRRKRLLETDSRIEGFNVGVNCGKAAGQTIFHCHVHLIPRRIGDIPDPQGGIRGVIPEKMHYQG